jgi:hypothetical protein
MNPTDKPRNRSDIVAALGRVTAIDPSLIRDAIAMLEDDAQRIHHLNEALLRANGQ